jgi:hypothetical protein
VSRSDFRPPFGIRVRPWLTCDKLDRVQSHKISGLDRVRLAVPDLTPTTTALFVNWLVLVRFGV